MRAGKSALAATREAEAARIARWFRETDYGLAFYDAEGRALPISERERDRWERRAHAILERYLAEYDRAPAIAMIAVAVAVTALMAVDATLRELIGPVPSFVYGLVAMCAALWPLVVEFRYRRRLNALRREVAEHMPLRTPLPEAAARAAWRTNIFMMGGQAMIVLTIALGARAAWRGEEEIDPLVIAPVLLAIPLLWAARRVDARHRRTSW